MKVYGGRCGRLAVKMLDKTSSSLTSSVGIEVGFRLLFDAADYEGKAS